MRFPYHVNVCYLVNDQNEVLLQLKRRGFGQGKWNGPGGKIRPGEDLEEAVKREVKEETEIIANDLSNLGQLEFIFKDKEDWNNLMHVYVCRDFSGRPKDTGEGTLKWFKINELPFDRMWEDDRIWLPQALKGQYVHMRFYMRENGKLIGIKYLK